MNCHQWSTPRFNLNACIYLAAASYDCSWTKRTDIFGSSGTKDAEDGLRERMTLFDLRR